MLSPDPLSTPSSENQGECQNITLDLNLCWFLQLNRGQPLGELNRLMLGGDSGDLLLTLLAHHDRVGGDDQLALLADTEDSAIGNPHFISQMGAESHGGLADELVEDLAHVVFLLGLCVRVYGLDQRVKHQSERKLAE